MLERIREGSQGIVAKSILGLVILTFAISGIGSYIGSQADTALATVNDVEIGQSAFENAYQTERARMEKQYGQMFEQLLADENYVASFRKNILDRLVVEELQKQSAKDLGVRVGDEQIRKAILEMPEFQQNGVFNNDTYLALLRQAGFQPSQFREYIREQMSRSQYLNGVFSTEFVLPNEEAAFNTLINQTRSFELVTFSVADLKAEINPEQAELESYYQSNKLSFQTEEKVAVEYVLIDSALLANDVVIADQDIENYYNENIGDYTQEEKRKLSHILVELGDDADAAKARIEEVQAKLTSGEDFAALAPTYSDDTFSAENGGDLDWVESGVMGEEFDKAAFALTTVGDITDVIETEFGYHLVKLTELQAAVVKPFAEVKSDIKSVLVENKVVELYIEAQTKAVEIAFEVADTLQDAAEEAGLTMQTTELLSRSQLTGVLAQAPVVSQLFDSEFIAEGINSDIIELSDEKSILVRVTDHQASQQQSLDDVITSVTEAVVSEKARSLAQEKANTALTRANAGESFSAQSLNVKSHSDIARTDRSFDSNVMDVVFSSAKPIEGKVEYAMTTLLNGDAAVVSVNKVGQTSVVNNNANAQLRSLVDSITTKAYIEAIKANADITINLN